PQPSRSHQGGAGDAPIRQGVEVVIVSAIGAALNRLGSIIAETGIEMAGTDSPPEVILPHTIGGTPQGKTHAVFDGTAIRHYAPESHFEGKAIGHNEEGNHRQGNQGQQSRKAVTALENQ